MGNCATEQLHQVLSTNFKFVFTCIFFLSTDEGALVDAARNLGVVFEKRSSNSISIRVVSVSIP